MPVILAATRRLRRGDAWPWRRRARDGRGGFRGAPRTGSRREAPASAPRRRARHAAPRCRSSAARSLGASSMSGPSSPPTHRDVHRVSSSSTRGPQATLQQRLQAGGDVVDRDAQGIERHEHRAMPCDGTPSRGSPAPMAVTAAPSRRARRALARSPIVARTTRPRLRLGSIRDVTSPTDGRCRRASRRCHHRRTLRSVPPSRRRSRTGRRRRAPAHGGCPGRPGSRAPRRRRP